MTDLVRFRNWVIDRNEIKFVDIVIDPEDKRKAENNHKRHNVIIYFKNNSGLQTLTVNCWSKFNAETEIDELTAKLQIPSIGSQYDHYLLKRIDRLSSAIEGLDEDVKRLMRSYSSKKKKVEKEGTA